MKDIFNYKFYSICHNVSEFFINDIEMLKGIHFRATVYTVGEERFLVLVNSTKLTGGYKTPRHLFINSKIYIEDLIVDAEGNLVFMLSDKAPQKVYTDKIVLHYYKKPEVIAKVTVF